MLSHFFPQCRLGDVKQAFFGYQFAAADIVQTGDYENEHQRFGQFDLFKPLYLRSYPGQYSIVLT